jgi:integrase
MLKLSKRHGSKFWTARGTYLGVKVDRSTGACDKGEAQAILAKIQNEIFERASGHVPEKAGPTFAEAVILYCKKGGEKRFLEPLLKYFGDLPIAKIDQAAIDEAAMVLYPNGSSSTRNRQVYTPVSAILKSAGLKMPLNRLENPQGVIRWLRHDEAARLIASCSPHLKPLVMFMLYTGARAGEALWLEWRNVDLARAHVSFEKTKNGDPRGVPLHRDLVAELANLPYRTGLVFRRPDGEPYSIPTGDHDRSAGSKIKTSFKGACTRAGIENFRVHDLRHTFATWHYQRHRDLRALQILGGWKTLSMVTRYTHANTDNYREGINAMPTLQNWADHGQKIAPMQKIV